MNYKAKNDEGDEICNYKCRMKREIFILSLLSVKDWNLNNFIFSFLFIRSKNKFLSFIEIIELIFVAVIIIDMFSGRIKRKAYKNNKSRNISES